MHYCLFRHRSIHGGQNVLIINIPHPSSLRACTCSRVFSSNSFLVWLKQRYKSGRKKKKIINYMDTFTDYGHIIACRSDLGLYKRTRRNLIGCD